MGEHPARIDQAVGVLERLREADAFLAVADPFLELSLVSENPSQMTEGLDARRCGLAKAFPAQISFEPLEDFPQKLLGLSIVARAHAGRAEVEISRHLEVNIPKRLANSLGVLAELE